MIGSERSAGRGLSIVGTGRDGEGERGGEAGAWSRPPQGVDHVR